jgi:predicted CXXCH cytochrome family protein
MRCAACHSSGRGVAGQMLVKSVAEGLCLNCHPAVAREVPYPHAPVLANACLECHEPHESNGPGLLLRATGNVCHRCHPPIDLSTGPYHFEAATATDSACITCHLPHGGPQAYMLKPTGGG